MKKRRANGEGCQPYKRIDGRWQSIYTYIGKDGERKRGSVSAQTKAECAKKLAEQTHSINHGTFTEPSKMTVADWIMEWYRMFGEPRWKSYGTRTVHLSNINNHIIPALGGEMLQKLDTRHVQNFLDNLLRAGKKPITVHKIMEPLRGALKKAFALEMISKNPFDHIELPTVRQDEVVHLSQPEMLALLDALPDTTHGRCCELILRTGLRKSEVAGLEWRDIDFDGRYNNGQGIIWVRRSKQYIKPIENGIKADHQVLDIKPTKSRKGYRQIPIKPETRALFQRQLSDQRKEALVAGPHWQGGRPGAPETPVFATRVGTVPDMTQARNTLQRACEEAATRVVTLHPLRHSCLTAMAKGGKVDLRTLAELAWHEKPAFTAEKYLHSDLDAMSDALDVLGEKLERKQAGKKKRE